MTPTTRSSLTMAIGSLLVIVACAGEYSKNQSPFEWNGLRAGMSLSKLNRLSQPGSAWKCNQFIRSAVGLERRIALESSSFGGGRVIAMVDTVGQRVLHLHYSPSLLPADTQRKADFEGQLTALALKWDSMPGVIRHPVSMHEGVSFALWETRDSLWRAGIYYSQVGSGPARPAVLEIEELNWAQHLLARIDKSMKGEPGYPESQRKPNAACDALLKSL